MPRVWERLTRIGINRKIPWCVMGDFNAIRRNGEKLEGLRRSEAHFQPFNDMIQPVNWLSCLLLGMNSRGEVKEEMMDSMQTWLGLWEQKWVLSVSSIFSNLPREKRL